MTNIYIIPATTASYRDTPATFNQQIASWHCINPQPATISSYRHSTNYPSSNYSIIPTLPINSQPATSISYQHSTDTQKATFIIYWLSTYPQPAANIIPTVDQLSTNKQHHTDTPPTSLGDSWCVGRSQINSAWLLYSSDHPCHDSQVIVPNSAIWRKKCYFLAACLWRSVGVGKPGYSERWL